VTDVPEAAGTTEAGGDPTASPPPSAARLAALPNDAWAWLLPHVRAALHDLDDGEVTALVRRLRAAPTSRLAGGRTRAELDALIAAGGALWRDVAARIGAAPDPPNAVAALLDPTTPPSVGRPPEHADGRRSGRVDGADRADEERQRAELRARDRARRLRAERDDLRRQLEGAAARAARADAERSDLQRVIDELRAELSDVRRELDQSAGERDRAVQRERRRRDAEVRDLTATVAELRRADHERHVAARRREEAAQQQAERDRADAARRDAEAREAAAPRRLVPGRPSQLPAGIRPGTTEHAEVLLHAGRLVLVDGYNVSKQHQPDLDLEEQRAWLVRTLAALAARRRVRPRVVFDGESAGAARPATGARVVEVAFTPSGVTADDELVLSVEATDEPVTVVTDDRDLTARLVAAGADVVGTAAFLGATRA
jgi:hypothetical protein